MLRYILPSFARAFDAIPSPTRSACFEARDFVISVHRFMRHAYAILRLVSTIFAFSTCGSMLYTCRHYTLGERRKKELAVSIRNGTSFFTKRSAHSCVCKTNVHWCVRKHLRHRAPDRSALPHLLYLHERLTIFGGVCTVEITMRKEH